MMIFRVALFALLFGLLFPAAAARLFAADERPNFVLIIADDMGADDCGANGHPHIQTPNLDRLARGGLAFDQAILTCSSCSPSRASIITGRYPHSTDAEQLHWPLPEEQTTFVEVLRQQGYYTAASGKWHLGNAARRGFDAVDEVSNASFQLQTNAQGESLVMAEAKNASGCAGWTSTLANCPSDKPFFLWLAAVDPHRDYLPNIIPEPHSRNDVVLPPFIPDTPKVRDDMAMYYDEITRMDSYIGRVLDALDQRGATENTYVIFISDNGRPFPRCKTTVLDSGIRTPMFIRRPGHVPEGTRTDALVSSIDISATVLDLAGIAPPETVQGESFSKVLSDPKLEHHPFVFAEHNWHDYDAYQRAVRSPSFKYIRNFDRELTLSPPADAVRSPTFQEMQRLRQEELLTAVQKQCFDAPRAAEELYDLKQDPDELVNVAQRAEYQAALEEHRAQLDAWRLATFDAARTVRSSDEFDRESGGPLANRARPRAGKFDGFQPMFQDAELPGWTAVSTAPSTWAFNDGVLACTGKPIGVLRTERMYQNFVMELEWRHLVPRGNAGVFVWADAITARGVPFHRGIEVQILEDAYGNTESHTTHGDIFPIHGATMIPINGHGGSLAFPTEHLSKPSPAWNHYRIVCNDGEIALAVNGTVVTRGKNCSPKKGYICLESEGGVVEYRNVRIKEMPDTPIEEAAVATADEGYRCLYRGIDLVGWMAAEPRLWKPQDWVLAYQSTSGAEAETKSLTSRESFGEASFIVDVRRKNDSAGSEFRFRGATVSTANEAIRAALSKPGGWDRLQFRLDSNGLTIEVNGQAVINNQPQTETTEEGPLSIVPEGDVDFANIYVRESPSETRK